MTCAVSARLASGLLLLAFAMTPNRAGARADDRDRSGGGVEVVFDLSQPTQGPFPSDRFTVPDDPNDPNNTGLRVNMPKPDCNARPTDCNAVDLLNVLDAFDGMGQHRPKSAARAVNVRSPEEFRRFRPQARNEANGRHGSNGANRWSA